VCRSLVSLMLAAIAVTGVGCSDPFTFTPQSEVRQSVPFDAPEYYAQWWRDTEACSGLTGDMSRIRWYVVPNSSSFDYRGASYAGYWWETHDIVLAGRAVDQQGVVRHEMLHDLLATGDHPDEYFKVKCAGVVNE
jgi:hypothetical protein